MKKFLFSFALFTLITAGSFAQNSAILLSPDNRIVVLGEATLNLAADRVVLTVNLSARDSLSVQRAYDKHKRLEASLVRFLKEAALPDTSVRYQLFNVRQEFEYAGPGRRQVGAYVTTQSVTLTLTDVRQYATFLVKLIGAGFSDVNASFNASKSEQFQGKLLENAVTVARKKAEVLASASGRRIKRVSKIMDTEETDPTFNRVIPMAMAAQRVSYDKAVGGSDLTDIPQTIRLAMQVKVVFELE
ncbi:MAG: SIMPL domain-containing protein [Sphingobacteriaceae bacterium]|nr:SIMPL domain-containing protein [Cytophagaceae bacterium]